MATIDDILNASDSDDEVENKKLSLSGINLEALLEDEDDDEDMQQPATSSRSGFDWVMRANAESQSILQDPGISRSMPELENRRMSLRTHKPDTVKVYPNNEDASPSTRAYRAEDERGKDVHNMSGMGFLASLDMAESRERRNIASSTGKDVSSVLQMKRGKNMSTSQGAGTSSNRSIKYAEMDILSTQLRRNSSYKQHGPGIATAIHVHKRFFVIGTSSGLLLLFDRNQEIRQVIGSSLSQGSRCCKAVTAIDVLPSGAVILCGYLTGEISLWDVAKGIALKRVTDIHSCRITRLKFIISLSDPGNLSIHGNSSAIVPSEFTVVSVDAKGVVNRGHFSKSLWSNLSAEFDLLLDGQSGIVLDMAALSVFADDFDKPASPGSKVKTEKDIPVVSPILSNMSFVAFNSLLRTYIVQIQPAVRVIHRWTAPPNSLAEMSTSSFSKPAIPASSLDWAWTIKRQFRWPMLARSWGENVQILSLDCGTTEVSTTTASADSCFVFTVIAENVVSTDGRGILCVKWVDNERLILLSATQLFVTNSKLEILDTTMLPVNVASSVVASVEVRAPDEAVPACISVSGSCLFVLSPDSLTQMLFQSWTQQADQLIRDGNWLEALATVLDSCGFWSAMGSDKVKNDAFFENRNKVYTERYIRKYVELAVSQPALIANSSISTLVMANSSAKSHFHLVSGVCIEFCMAARRFTLLFGEIFDAFLDVRQENLFLEALEPYILNRSIRNLPAHILNHMIEAENNCPTFSCLERCILHLDLQNTDFEFLSRVLLEKRMYSGFLYVYAYGVMDVIKAFQILFAKMTSISKEQQLEVSPGRRASSSIKIPLPSPEEAEIGYKMLLYLKYAASSITFPRGESAPTTTDSISSLMIFLLSESFQTGNAKNDIIGDWQNHRFPYLSYLVLIDPGATMFCISKGLVFLEERAFDSNVLVSMYKQLFDFCGMVDSENRKIHNFLVECTFSQLCNGCLPLSPNIINALIRHGAQMPHRADAEVLMMKLARGQLQPSVLQGMREYLEDHNFWRAALLLPNHAKKHEGALVKKFEKAITYYFSLSERSNWIPSSTSGQAIQQTIFEFVDAAFTSFTLDGISAETASAIVKILANSVQQLADINLARTRMIVCSHMLNDVHEVIVATAMNPALQLDLLSCIIDHLERDPEKGLSDVLESVEVLTYIKLLVAFAPEKVFPFLLSHQDFPVDHCLELFREKDIGDATALLLERNGEIVAALNLLLTEFARKIEDAKKSVENMLRLQDPLIGDILTKSGSSRLDATLLSMPFYSSLGHIMNCICGLCSRNATDGSSRSLELWFTALDHFLEKKRKLSKRDS